MSALVVFDAVNGKFDGRKFVRANYRQRFLIKALKDAGATMQGTTYLLPLVVSGDLLDDLERAARIDAMASGERVEFEAVITTVEMLRSVKAETSSLERRREKMGRILLGVCPGTRALVREYMKAGVRRAEQILAEVS